MILFCFARKTSNKILLTSAIALIILLSFLSSSLQPQKPSNKKLENFLSEVRIIIKKNKEPTQTKTIELAPYTDIDINTTANISIGKEEKYQTKVSGTKYDLKHLKMKVNNGVLIINNDTNYASKVQVQKLHIKLQTPNLKTLKQQGVGNIDIQGPFKLSTVDTKNTGNMTIKGITSPNFQLKSANTGNTDISGINSNNCDITIHGVGNVTVSGSCTSARLTSHSFGNLDASNLKAQKLDIQKQGVGNIIRP